MKINSVGSDQFTAKILDAAETEPNDSKLGAMVRSIIKEAYEPSN